MPGTIIQRVGLTQYLVRVGRSIRYVHVDHILKSDKAAEDMISPDSLETVVGDTPVVPPHMPNGILHVQLSADLPSEVLACGLLFRPQRRQAAIAATGPPPSRNLMVS